MAAVGRSMDEEIRAMTPELVAVEFQKYKRTKTDTLVRPHRIRIPLGVDGVDWRMFEANLDSRSRGICNRLKSGRYFFSPFREVEVSKEPHLSLEDARRLDRVRTLSIACLPDVIAQRLIYRVIQPQAEHLFSEIAQDVSFAYRCGKSAPAAARCLRGNIIAGYPIAIDADIKGFFDNIPHDRLFAVIEAFTGSDNPLVQRHLQKYVSADRVRSSTYDHNCREFCRRRPKRVPREKGIPQGGVLSGMIANLYLHSFDKWVTEDLAAQFGVRYVRYADDFVVLLNDPQVVDEVCLQIRDRLGGLGLELNDEKTIVKNLSRDSLDFVGFSISDRAIRVRSKNVTKFKKRILDVVRACPINSTQPRRSLGCLVRALNYRLLGNEFPEARVCTACQNVEARRNWISFFATVTDIQQLRALDRWIRETIYCEAHRTSGVRFSRGDLKRAGLASLERIYYRYRHEIGKIFFCSCGPLDADFVKQSEFTLLFNQISS